MPDSKESRDGIQMPPMRKPEFVTDSGGSQRGSSGTAFWRYKGSVSQIERKAQIEIPEVTMCNSINGFNVGIRPPRWKERIWIGQLETRERAQYVADTGNFAGFMLGVKGGVIGQRG